MKQIWEENIKSEIQFWDAYFHFKGLNWHEDYKCRLLPDFPLQERPALLLSGENNKILDVGAGPLTYLGKRHMGNTLDITAIDPLADEYDVILSRYNIIPVIRTQKLDAEELSLKYKPDSFDLVFARNCLDHSCNPEEAILQMLYVVKKEKYILLEHKPDEAENQKYNGLHQWNFSMNHNGDFIIRSKYSKVNITKKYSEFCSVISEIIYEAGEGFLLINKILKK